MSGPLKRASGAAPSISLHATCAPSMQLSIPCWQPPIVLLIGTSLTLPPSLTEVARPHFAEVIWNYIGKCLLHHHSDLYLTALPT